MTEPDELVTVVIPARNEEQFIRGCLESVQRQTYQTLQIIVVDGASTDATPRIVKEAASSDPRIELLHNPERVIPRSLNLAVSAARGRWLVRIDAHAAVPEDYVERAVRHLRTGRWMGVGGRKDGVGVTPAGRAVASVMASPFGVGNSTYHYGTAASTVEHVPFGAYPLEVVRRLGGWDERLTVNQDFEFDYRIRATGGELWFDPEMVILWHCRQSLPDLFRQYRRYGRGKTVVARMHPASMRLRHLVAPALVGAGIAAMAVSLTRPRRGVAIVAPYVAALSVASIRTARTLDDPTARVWVAPAFAAMHIGWGIGFWEGVGDVIAQSARSALLARQRGRHAK